MTRKDHVILEDDNPRLRSFVAMNSSPEEALRFVIGYERLESLKASSALIVVEDLMSIFNKIQSNNRQPPTPDVMQVFEVTARVASALDASSHPSDDPIAVTAIFAALLYNIDLGALTKVVKRQGILDHLKLLKRGSETVKEHLGRIIDTTSPLNISLMIKLAEKICMIRMASCRTHVDRLLTHQKLSEAYVLLNCVRSGHLDEICLDLLHQLEQVCLSVEQHLAECT